jgi:hypothetical protein
MTWKKAVLVLTAVMAVALIIVAFRPPGGSATDVREEANLQIRSSGHIPYTQAFPLKGFALSGNWKGTGVAQVWIVTEGIEYLVLDTRNLKSDKFAEFCLDSCDIPVSFAESLIVIVSDGVLSIDTYDLKAVSGPTGLALCPNCKRIIQRNTPDHFLLLTILLLVISVVGAHALGHCCKRHLSKKVLFVLFLAGFAMLGGLFAAYVGAPDSVAAVARKAGSVFAALGVVTLFTIGGIEMRRPANDPEKPESNIWKDLERAEEEWGKKQ